MPSGRQWHLQQTQHVRSLKGLKFDQRFSFDVLAENRSGRLADRTTLAVKKGFLDCSGIIQLQFHSNLIATERIFLTVRARRTLDVPFVVRAFVMVEDVIVVQFFVHLGTDCDCLDSAGGRLGELISTIAPVKIATACWRSSPPHRDCWQIVRSALGFLAVGRAIVLSRRESKFLEPQAQPPVGRVCEAFELDGDKPRLVRVTSTVQSGVIVLFTDDGTLLTFIGWGLVWLCGLAVIAGPLAVAVRRFLTSEVWSLFTLLLEMTDEQLLPGQLVPVRCPIRVASVSICSQPPDQRWPHAGAGLRGWSSENR